MLALAQILFLLVLLHFVIDYQFQSNEVAVGKNPKNSPHLTVPWYYWMLSHVSCHAVGVYLVTHSVSLAACELVAHFVIDWGKCRGYYGLHEDQGMHVMCKVAWVVLLGIMTAL